MKGVPDVQLCPSTLDLWGESREESDSNHEHRLMQSVQASKPFLQLERVLRGRGRHLVDQERSHDVGEEKSYSQSKRDVLISCK